MSNTSWLSVHLFYYDNLSALLAECVKPAVEECQARHLVEKYFFIRYWQGGPHIRLRLLPLAEKHEQEIKSILLRHTQAFFVTYPSTSTIDKQQYEEVTGHLSHLEYGQDHRVALYPNNSLHYIPYQPEYEHYGGIKAMPYVETHFMQSSAIALNLCASGMNRKQLMGQATVMILLAATLYEKDAGKMAEMFDNHLLSWHSMPAHLRENLYTQFGRQYRQQREQLHQLIGRLLKVAQQHTQEQLAAPLDSWWVSVYNLNQALQQLDEVGELQTRVEQPAGGKGPLIPILFRCLHMHNNRLGILMLEEAYTFFLLKQVLSETARLDSSRENTIYTKGAL